jgi:hypothetical protein
MDKIVLALALREENRNSWVVLCALAHYCKVNIDRRDSAQLRTRQKAMNLLMWYSQRAIPDGLFDGYESVIELYIRKDNTEKFRAAFRFQERFLLFFEHCRLSLKMENQETLVAASQTH